MAIFVSDVKRKSREEDEEVKMNFEGMYLKDSLTNIDVLLQGILHK